MKKTTEFINIPPLDIRHFSVTLVGDSPLLVHRWSEKAKKQILDKQMKRASMGKEVKDPFQDFCDSLYWLSERPPRPTMEEVLAAKFGFPAVAFKTAAIDAGYQSGAIATKAGPRGAFHVTGARQPDLVEIQGVLTMREDMVNVGMGKADIRYRGQFDPWSVVLPIRYNARAISAEQIVNLLNLAGFAVGVGEWRTARDGSHGMFHVAAG